MKAYVDDVIVKSMSFKQHLADLEETFQTLKRYNLCLNPEKCSFLVGGGKFRWYMIFERGIDANLKKIKAILDMPPPRTIKEV